MLDGTNEGPKPPFGFPFVELCSGSVVTVGGRVGLAGKTRPGRVNRRHPSLSSTVYIGSETGVDVRDERRPGRISVRTGVWMCTRLGGDGSPSDKGSVPFKRCTSKLGVLFLLDNYSFQVSLY